MRLRRCCDPGTIPRLEGLEPVSGLPYFDDFPDFPVLLPYRDSPMSLGATCLKNLRSVGIVAQVMMRFASTMLRMFVSLGFLVQERLTYIQILGYAIVQVKSMLPSILGKSDTRTIDVITVKDPIVKMPMRPIFCLAGS